MKRLITMLTAVATVCLSMPSLADEYTYTDADGFTWSCQSVEATASEPAHIVITGVEYDTDVVGENPELVIPAGLPSSPGNTESLLPVTSIAEDAFTGDSYVVSVTIPESVTSIGDSAFADCAALEDVTFPGSTPIEAEDSDSLYFTSWLEIGDSAFANCVSLGSITLPPHLMNLYDGAFSGCTALEDVMFESAGYFGLNSSLFIGDKVFSGCASLTEINLPPNLEELGQYAFEDCIALESVVFLAEEEAHPFGQYLSVGDYAFDGCESLTSVEFLDRPFTVTNTCSDEPPYEIIDSKTTMDYYTSIGDYAFAECPLDTVDLGTGVGSIGEGAFSDCTELPVVVIPATVEFVCDNAFNGCTALESVYFTANEEFDAEMLVDVGCSAFGGCTKLTSVIFEDRPHTVVVDEEDEEVTHIECPASIHIGASAFEGCKALDALYLGMGVNAIGHDAFRSCDALRFVEFPGTLEQQLGERAFAYCENLAEVQFYYISVYDEREGEDAKNDAFYGTPYFNRFRLVIEDGVVTGYKGEPPDGGVSLDEEYLPFGITEIADGAFEGLAGLIEVYIPASVEQIGENAFAGCPDLEAVGFTTPDMVRDDETGEESLIGAAELDIGEGAFAGCVKLADVVVEDRPIVKESWEDDYGREQTANRCEAFVDIGDSAFSGCEALASLCLGAGVRTIGVQAFSDCKALAELEIPATTTDIEPVAFKGCEKLGYVVFASDEMSAETSLYIDEEAFAGLPSLVTVEFCEYPVADRILGIDEETAERERYCAAETRIGTSAFAGCTALGELLLASGVRSVGVEAFKGCTALEYVEFPELFESIGEEAFADTGIADVAFFGESLIAEIEIAPDAFLNTPYAAKALVDDDNELEGTITIDKTSAWHAQFMAENGGITARTPAANGMTYGTCYALGIDPTDPEATVGTLSVEISGGKVNVELWGISPYMEIYCQLQSRTTLPTGEDTAWENEGEPVKYGDSAVMTSAQGADPAKFYRVAISLVDASGE